MNILQNSHIPELHNSASLGSFLTQFFCNALYHSSEITELDRWSKFSMPVLLQRLSSWKLYQTTLSQAQSQKFNDYCLSIPIFENQDIRLSLMAIEPGREIPLHDHPEQSGLTLVIKGQARIVQCETATESANNPNLKCMLSIVKNRIYTAGETSCFTNQQRNIHSMDAISERCVLLVVHSIAKEIDLSLQKTFFFPVCQPKTVGTQINCQRLRADTLANFRKRQAKKNQRYL